MTDRLIVRRGYNWVSRFGRLTTIYGSLLFCGATFNHIFTFFSKASLIVSTPMGTTGFIQILKFHVHYHDLVNSYRISKSRMTTICWFSCSLNSGLISSLMTNDWLSNRSNNTIYITSRGGTILHCVTHLEHSNSLLVFYIYIYIVRRSIKTLMTTRRRCANRH